MAESTSGNPRRRISIRVQLSFVLGACMTAVAVVLILISHVQSKRYLLGFAEQHMHLARDAIAGRAYAYFEPITTIGETIASIDPSGIGPEERQRLFFQLAESVMDRHSQVFNIFLGRPDGSYLRTGGVTPQLLRMAGVPEEESPTRLRAIYPAALPGSDRETRWMFPDRKGRWVSGTPTRSAFDPRQRRWYLLAEKVTRLQWTRPHVMANGVPGIIATKSLDEGAPEPAGAIGVAVRLADLARFLQADAASPGTVTFLATDSGVIIAHPELVGPDPAITIDEGGGLAMSLADDDYRRSHGIEARLHDSVEPDTGSVYFQHDGRDYIGAASLLTLPTGRDEILYMATPVRDFVRYALEANAWALAVSVLVLLALLLLALRLSRRVAAPIEDLAALATTVQAQGVSNVPEHPGSMVREIDDAGVAFNAMVEGLRERELVRDLFGKFVPQEVARALIRQKGALDPVSTECTVLFTDIEGFTAMSERLPPQELVNTLNAFFSHATHIIEQHGGVITQFQGDAILAIFNVPVANADHAARAVKAGVELERSSAEMCFAGQTVRIRVGINTGTVVAGNVGAKGRLHYTVHGDAVNVAARLEQMNKQHGTRILVSEATRKLCPDMHFEPIGESELRGKRERLSIYTIRS